MAEPTAQEQYFIELVNRARLDPLGEAARYGIDLNKDLPAGTITAIQKQPLAVNFLLNYSADAHSNWMLAADVFSHTGVNGSSPMQRMQAAGYTFTGSWWNGENIAYVGTTGSITVDGSIGSLHRNLFLSAGHRENILNGAFKEVGIGTILGQFTSGGTTYNTVMATENFAKTGTSTFVTGVVYNDSDGDKFYSIGEGKGAVTTTLKSGSTVLGAQSTWAAGGYALSSVTTGAVTLEFSGGGLAQSIGVNFILESESAKIDLSNSHDISSSVSATLLAGAVNLKLLGINSISGYGNELANTITGNAGNNMLLAGGGSDLVFGGAGNDWLRGDDGNDTMDGGTGSDTVGYGVSASSVNVNLAAGSASGVAIGVDTLVSIENINGSNFDDLLTGNAENNFLYGNGGNDVLWGGVGADYLDGGDGLLDRAGYFWASSAVVVSLASGTGTLGEAIGDTLVNIECLGGSNFDDLLTGNAENNFLYGNGGNDVLWGGVGADYLDGGDGLLDRAGYFWASSAVVVSLATGAGTAGEALGDTLVNIECIGGSNFDDLLTGNSSNNSLYGNGGNDVLWGSTGADYLDGGDGLLDRAGYFWAASAVAVSLTSGTGTAGEALGDTLVNIECLGGSNYNDVLEGNGLDNLIIGNGGNDTLTGGAGADRFDFNGSAFGNDRVTDFMDGVDKLGFFAGAATKLADFSIAGNGTTNVTLTCLSGSVVLQGSAAIFVTVDDFLFA